MSIKDQKTTSEPLAKSDFDRLINGLHERGEFFWELYCVVSFVTALRISDVLKLTWTVLRRELSIVREGKTGKIREIEYSDSVRNKIEELYVLIGSPDPAELMFKNWRTGKPYTPQSINRKLKEFLVEYQLPIERFSSHSFRKTFGRNFYDSQGQTEHSIIVLSDILNHESPRTTRTYIGLSRDDRSKAYLSIDL